MRHIPPPPVPLVLREMLKDYPALIQELQEVLNKIVTDPPKGIPPFEWAVWRLEDTLSAFSSDASEELKAAQQSGDPETIRRAQEKVSLMRRTGFKSRWIGDDDLWNYFQLHKGAFE